MNNTDSKKEKNFGVPVLVIVLVVVVVAFVALKKA